MLLLLMMMLSPPPRPPPGNCQVWVVPELRDDGCIYWTADSDSQLTKVCGGVFVCWCIVQVPCVRLVCVVVCVLCCVVRGGVC